MGVFYLVSQGCAKNLVDSEVILGSMDMRGWNLTEDPVEASVLVINTCGFIQDAVEEAIGEIFELVKIKERYPEKRIIVVGCLVQRYKEQLTVDLPEVDLFVGTEGPVELAGLLEQLENGLIDQRLLLPARFLMSSDTPRKISTPFFRAWLKITEGCNNRCSYCMIPMIRGELRSRAIDDLVREAQRLEIHGVKELSLIAQDSTAYGNDLDSGISLERLLEQLLEKTAIPWIRLLYLYPTGVTDQLLDLLAKNERIVPYLDIPMQHVNNTVLRAMNRRYTSSDLLRLVERIRSRVPNIALRTTFLVGFPGETEKAFREIEEFMRKVELDHIGVFTYANEEGAPSEKFTKQVSEKVKNKRKNHLLAVQAELSAKIQKKYIGRIESVLVEGLSSETDLLLQGRTKYQAPEVDGIVFINDGVANPGDIVNVAITDSQVYDLVGGIVEEDRTNDRQQNP